MACVAGESASAPRGGQVRVIRVKGCAVKDVSAPTQRSQGVPVNTIGGFVPSGVCFPWYPQGVPLEVLASSPRSSMASFLDADISGGVYTHGGRPRGVNSGWGTEPGEELMLQVVEGVGGDAYGLCPGGTADEPTSSNRVLCAYHRPYDGHAQCGRESDRPRRRL